MGKIVVFFRGRNTANIIEDARRAGVLREKDPFIIVFREDDRLARPGDVTVRCALDVVLDYDEIVVVGNRGATDQAISFVSDIAEMKGYANGQGGSFEPRWEVIGLQPDGITHLAGDRIVTDKDE